jgi:hypothetical protein
MVSIVWLSCIVYSFLDMRNGCNQAPGIEVIVTWFYEKDKAIAMRIKKTGIPVGRLIVSFLLPAIALEFDNRRYLLIADRSILIDTWVTSYYEKEGYVLLQIEEKISLLKRFWNIPARQVKTFVALAKGGWEPL